MNSIIWCEDSKSGFEFWKIMFHAINPDFIVETKKNISELCKAIKRIDGENVYYILVDQVVDNPEVIREVSMLKKQISTKNNVELIKLHSFEGILLSFAYLEDWIFAKEDELKEKRKTLLLGKNLFVRIVINGGNVTDASELSRLMDEMQCNTTEQLAAKLLFNITRNTGFATSKGKLGDCFKNNCCELLDRQNDDICGLDNNRLTLSEKMDYIAKNSALTPELKRVGII